MPRFSWHVEEGGSAWIPPGGLVKHGDTRVQHALCQVELPGEHAAAEVCFSVPPHFLAEGYTHDVGVVIGHGADAGEWKGRALTELAVALAASGAFALMRLLLIFKKSARCFFL